MARCRYDDPDHGVAVDVDGGSVMAVTPTQHGFRMYVSADSVEDILDMGATIVCFLMQHGLMTAVNARVAAADGQVLPYGTPHDQEPDQHMCLTKDVH